MTIETSERKIFSEVRCVYDFQVFRIKEVYDSQLPLLPKTHTAAIFGETTSLLE